MREIQSENADTVEEFYEEAKGVLSDLGVPDPTVGEEARIEIPETGELKLYDTQVYEVTRPMQKALNGFPRRGSERVVNRAYDRPICNIFGCNVTQTLGIECVKTNEKYVDPEIDAMDIPAKITNATAYLNPFNARVEGTVEVKAENESEPGEKVTEKEYKCKDEIDKDTEVEEESGILDFQAEHDIISIAADERLASPNTSSRQVPPNSEERSTAPFEKTGTLETIESIISNWSSGVMKASIRGLFDVAYNWRGSISKKTFNVDTGADLPVEGGVDILW